LARSAQNFFAILLDFTDPARESLKELKQDKGLEKRCKAVKAALKKGRA